MRPDHHSKTQDDQQDLGDRPYPMAQVEAMHHPRFYSASRTPVCDGQHIRVHTGGFRDVVAHRAIYRAALAYGTGRRPRSQTTQVLDHFRLRNDIRVLNLKIEQVRFVRAA